MRKVDYMSSMMKKENSGYAMRCILRKQSDLSLTQLRRVFCYAYFALRGKNAQSIYNKQKRLSKQ